MFPQQLNIKIWKEKHVAHNVYPTQMREALILNITRNVVHKLYKPKTEIEKTMNLRRVGLTKWSLKTPKSQTTFQCPRYRTNSLFRQKNCTPTSTHNSIERDKPTSIMALLSTTKCEVQISHQSWKIEHNIFFGKVRNTLSYHI